MGNEEDLIAKIQAGINEFLGIFFLSKTASSGTSELTNQQFISTLEELGLCLQVEDIKLYSAQWM